jgi:IS30 family transposase
MFYGGAIMTVLQKEQIKALRGQGLSYLEIADKVGIPKNTVKTFCRRNAVKAVTASDETKNKDCEDLCLQCGRPLNKTRSTKKFCRDACRLAYHKANREPSAVCAHCGEKFDNNGNNKRKFCSTACYIADRFPEVPREKAVAV